MKEFTLDIYKGNKKVKTVKAESVVITRGVTKKISKIIDLINKGDIKTMSESLDPITELLEILFPDITEEEWDGVQVKDMIKLIMELPKEFAEEALDINYDDE